MSTEDSVVYITDYVKGQEGVCDLLGERSIFRSIVCKFIDKLVKNGNWFTFCSKINDAQIDIFSIKNKDGLKLGSIIYDLLDTEDGYRTTLYRYLIHEYLCYYEIPTVTRQKDVPGFKDSFNKMLITSNIVIVANWLGISYEEANMKYGSRVATDNDFYRDDDLYSYLKLYVDKDGTRKVSRPRKELDLGERGTRIVPVFAINKGIKTLYEMANKDFYNVSFVKDSGQDRIINTCFDYDKLSSIYKDKGLLSSSYEEQFDGDFINSPSFSRGYIRVIEVGTNLKNHAVRSINVSRIYKIEKSEPDTTFIDIDLDSVKSTFLNMLETQNVNYNNLVDMLDIFQVGSTREYNGKRINSYFELESWVDAQETLLSTPFIKQLALFMIGNPEWFKGYNGESKVVEYSNDEDNLLSLDELDFDI